MNKKMRITWGEYLKNLPYAKKFRDDFYKEYAYAFSHIELLNAILAAPNKEEQIALLEIAAYTWDGDRGYGCVPCDDKIYQWQ